jgi:hypothetical protein
MHGVAVLHSGDYFIMTHHLVFCAAMICNIEVVSLAPVGSVRTGYVFQNTACPCSFFELVRKGKWGVDDDQLSIWYCDSSAVNMCWKHLSAVCLIVALRMAQKDELNITELVQVCSRTTKTECD